MGPSWDAFGSSWGALGALLSALGMLLGGALGMLLRALGRSGPLSGAVGAFEGLKCAVLEPQAFFFGPNSASPGKGPFSSAGGLPQALFFAKNDGFGGKMTFLRFIRDVNNPIGSLSSIFCFY